MVITKGGAVPAMEDCLTLVMAIPGVRAATLLDAATGLAVASAGMTADEAAERAAGAADLVRMVLAEPAFAAAATGDEIEEITVTGAAGHHLLALVTTATDARLCLHVVLDRSRGNVALARHRLRDVLRDLAAG